MYIWILGLVIGLYLALVFSIGYGLFRFAVMRPSLDYKKRPDLVPPAVRKLVLHHQQGKRKFLKMPHERHSISRDGLALNAYVMRQPKGKACSVAGLGEATVILLHGWQDSAGARMADALAYFEAGFSVIVPDLRAHGKSEGKYIDMGCVKRDDLKAWIAHYHESYGLEASDYALIWDGLSMGAATVLSLAGDDDLPENSFAILADCGYSSIMAQSLHMNRGLFLPFRIPALMVSNLLCKSLAGFSAKSPSPLEQIAKSSLPLLIIHGSEDRFVPFKMGYQLYKASPASLKAYWPVAGARHADSALVAGPLYMERKLSFLEAAVKKDGTGLFERSDAEERLILEARRELAGK